MLEKLPIALAICCILVYLVPSCDALVGADKHGKTGVCYSPFHHHLYPIHGGNGAHHMPRILREDFSKITRHFSFIRTYYSTYFGVSILPYAKQFNLKVYLGVYLTREWWREEQIKQAIQSAIDHRNDVLAIIVGNENVNFNPHARFPHNVYELVEVIKRIRSELHRHYIYHIPVGTSQRITDWLNRAHEMSYLAKHSDIIGANIYPFFSPNWDIHNPLQALYVQWGQLHARFPHFHHKLRITETGWPTQGQAPHGLPRSIPSKTNAHAYHRAFRNWNHDNTGHQPRFLFKYFDSNPSKHVNPEYERYFGLVRDNGSYK